MKPKLYHIYKAHELNPAWTPFLMNRFRTYNLPTEMVIREAGFYAPLQGRIYNTELFSAKVGTRTILVERTILYNIGLRTRGKDFHGVWDMGEEVFMVEHFENRGDDGHTDMELAGYVFVPASGIQEAERFGRKELAYVETLHEILMEEWSKQSH